MKTIFAPFQQNRIRVCAMIVACGMAAGVLAAQQPARRVSAEISNSAQSTLKGSLHPLAQASHDAGRVAGNVPIHGISMYFSRSAAQEADLQALLAAQQNPASPQYHQWLTPDQFAARFGMAQADIDAVQTWLQQQGFSIDSVARSRNMIRFSGTVSQVESAFGTEMHYYNVGGVKHFAPSTALSLPSALAPVVAGIRNLNDFRPQAQHIVPRRAFTSSQTGTVFFAPGDIATAYDVAPLYSASINGTGQTIAIAGQSAIELSDIENFQSAAGLTKKDPNPVIVPGSGDSTVEADGDEGESDIDVEWAGAMAPGATIDFVYTGSDTNYSVFDAVFYAIDEKLAQIISLSYASCELDMATSDFTTGETMMAQAAAQGQSVFAASGDQGSTGCFNTNSTDPLSTQEALAVNYPASSAYATGVGGTEITQANAVSTNSTYWVTASGSDVITSLKTYIPEVAWNDDSATNGLSASGGGTSKNIARPSWQSGVQGIPSGSNRLVPDVSLYASPNLPGYLYCTSDTSNWSSADQQASCNSGFRDAATGYLTAAGGTSFAAPIFAGMMALINQKAGYTTGQGLANPMLYQLAANSSTYASAFHDVTSGNNYCTAGSNYCASNGTTLGYQAGTGYDEVTGLGSVDLNNLVSAWPVNSGSSASLLSSTTTVSASNSAPTSGASVTFTVTVAPTAGSGIPSGTVNLSVDGGGTSYSNGGSTTSVTLDANGTATYTTSFSAAGPHQVVAQYAGDAAYAPSTGSATVTIGVVSSGKGSFTMTPSPTTLTVAQGSSGTESITITPAGGYTGTINLTYDTSNDTALQNLCVYAGSGINSSGAIPVASANAVTAQLTIDTNASDCVSATGASQSSHGMRISRAGVAANHPAPRPGPDRLPMETALAGLLAAGFLGRYSRKWRGAAWILVIGAAGLAISACGGGGSTSTTVPNPPKGTYTITLTGQDSVTASITNTTTFTLTIN